MDGTQTDTTDTPGTETDTPNETDKETSTDNKTDSQILKEENDALEFELKRKQTIRNEALLAGTSGGNVEAKPKEETAKEYADKVMEGSVKPE